MRVSSRLRSEGEPNRLGRPRRSGVLAPVAAAGVDGGADEDAGSGDDERDDQPDQHRAIGPCLKTANAEHEREQQRKPRHLGALRSRSRGRR